MYPYYKLQKRSIIILLLLVIVIIIYLFQFGVYCIEIKRKSCMDLVIIW